MRTALLIAAALLTSARIAAADPLVTGVDSVTPTVGDADRAAEFYTGTLGFQKVSDAEVAGDAYEHLEGTFGLRLRVVRLKLGDEALELAEPVTPHGRPIPADSRSDDRWFQHVAIIVSDMDKAYAWLRARHVHQVSPEPQALPAWNPNAGGIKAFYFRDPDDHNLEILWFPPDKGAPKWHRPAGDRLFLGIDHTAIAVADTDQSLAFYRDRLGLRVAGESDNYGPEQERLNNVFGAHLRITALRPPSGPGIELLEYLSPRDGRPFPSDEHPKDVRHPQTELEMEDAETSIASLQTAKTRFISTGTVSFEPGKLGFHRALLARAPDGHALAIVQP